MTKKSLRSSPFDAVSLETLIHLKSSVACGLSLIIGGKNKSAHNLFLLSC